MQGGASGRATDGIENMQRIRKSTLGSTVHSGDLLMHDVWKLSGQVSVTGFHLVMIFLLVLLDQSFVYS